MRRSEPIALILQRKHINEPESGHYVHITEERIAHYEPIWPP